MRENEIEKRKKRYNLQNENWFSKKRQKLAKLINFLKNQDKVNNIKIK